MKAPLETTASPPSRSGKTAFSGASLKERLDSLYFHFNRRELAPPDPVHFLYRYQDPLDREIAGLIAASLAYGRVKQIARSVAWVLERFPSPRRDVEESDPAALAERFSGFKHRFTTAGDLAALLFGVQRAVARFGSLNACFVDWLRGSESTVISALERFVSFLQPRPEPGRFGLLTLPSRGSACKRMNLYLRWMARSDGIDPGGWVGVGRELLIIPLDVHLHRICGALGFTRRRQADLKTALEVTAAFRCLAPEDPVRYDFALARTGMTGEDLYALLPLRKAR